MKGRGQPVLSARVGATWFVSRVSPKSRMCEVISKILVTDTINNGILGPRGQLTTVRSIYLITICRDLHYPQAHHPNITFNIKESHPSAYCLCCSLVSLTIAYRDLRTG